MLNPKLSPKEKRRLERYIHDLKWTLRNRGSLDFMSQQKLRITLTILGAKHPGSKLLQAGAKKIIWDDELSKERRLRELING